MKKQDIKALLAASQGKNLLFLGKEGVFTVKEIERFLKPYGMGIAADLGDNVAATVESMRLNPVEEMSSEEAYAQGLPSYKLEELEKLFSSEIKDDELLMALKLTKDSPRVLRMLENPHISDSLFIRLLEMYQWHDEDEDDNDDRSVVIATLSRYIEITPAERDQLYSTLTLKRLVREATDPALLHALLGFPDFSFRKKGQEQTSLHEVVATSPCLDEKTLKRLLSLRREKIDFYLAANPAIPLEQLHKFAQRDEKMLDEALASNESIDDTLFASLLDKDSTVNTILLTYQPITASRFESVVEKVTDTQLFALLGSNLHLDAEVIQKLAERENRALVENLCANKTVPTDVLVGLYDKGDERLYYLIAGNPNFPTPLLETLYARYREDTPMMQAVASNPNTPVSILRELYQRNDFEINTGLAKNPSTPLEILDDLKIDTRLRHALSENQTFIDYHNNTIVVV